MAFNLSTHAQQEIVRRRIPVADVHRVLMNPEQIVPADNGRNVYQSRLDFGGKTFLLRIVVYDKIDPGTVITVYRTSQIAKYWRP